MPSIIIKSGNPPTATPDELEVDPGEDIEFTGDVAFTIEFTNDSPDKGDPAKKRHSDKKKIKMKAKDNKTGGKLKFPYTIRIGDAEADPAIIIKAT